MQEKERGREREEGIPRSAARDLMFLCQVNRGLGVKCS